MTCKYSENCCGGWEEVGENTVRECQCRRENNAENMVQMEIPLAYQKCSLENFRPVRAKERGKAVDLPGALNCLDSFVLSGPPGSGKTHLLCALATMDARAGKRIRVFDEEAYYRFVNMSLFGDERELVPPDWLKKDFLTRIDTLYIDDLGKAKLTEAKRSNLFELLDGLTKMGKRFVFTTNLKGLGRWDTSGDPDFSRSLQRRMRTARVISFSGKG